MVPSRPTAYDTTPTRIPATVISRPLAHHVLTVTTLFAARGIITDVHGTVIAENVEEPDGTVVRRYTDPSLSQVLGYVSYPKKDAHGVYYDKV